MKVYQSKEWFVINWVNTSKSLQTLAKEVGVHVSTLERNAKKYKVTKHFKYSLNESKVNIEDPVFQYFLGLLYADGYVDKITNRISIDLSYSHGYKILNKLKIYFEYTGNIGLYKNGKGKYVRHRLTIANNHLFNTCNQLGLSPNKTDKIRLPKLPLYNNFLRGFVDGDGNIKKDEKCIRWYCHNPKFNLDVRELFPKCSIYPHKLGGTTFTLFGDNAVNFAKYIYTDHYYCLDTKLQIAKRKLEI